MAKQKRYYWLGHSGATDQDRFFLEALDSELWEEGNEDQWDTCWYTGMPDDDAFNALTPEKSINHIPGNNAVTIKSHLYETLFNARHRLAESEAAKRFDFFPETFSMPEDYQRFLTTARDESEQLWIKKPKNLSRGRGIDMVRHPSTVPFDDEWIMQRYLGNPHLCQGRKYVLRCYVLITSVEPLRVYWYQDGFAKLASEPYSTEDLSNLYRHLTNPDINEKNEEAEAAVTFISFKKYGEWLRSEGHDEVEFFNKLKDLITLTVISARETMRQRCQEVDADTSGAYELVGLDCMVDDNIKPWIIECNLSPSLSTYADPSAGADDEVVAKRSMVTDMVNLLGLNNAPDELPTTAEARADQEYRQRGQFELLFPAENANDYFNCFPVPRYADIQQAKWLCDVEIDQSRLALLPQEGSDVAFDDSIALLTADSEGQPQCIVPNELASWIWLNNAEQVPPKAIIQQLMQTVPQQSVEAYDGIAQQVWDVLADWSQANVFAGTHKSLSQIETTDEEPSTFFLLLGDVYLQVNSYCPNASFHLQAAGAEVLQTDQPAEASALLDIDLIPSKYGYSLIYKRRHVLDYLRLSRLIPRLCQLGMETLAAKQNALLLPGCLLQKEDKTVLLLCEKDSLLDSVAWSLNQTHAWSVSGHYCLLKDKQVTAASLPARVTQLEDMNHSWAVVEERNEGVFSYKPWTGHQSGVVNVEVDQLVIVKRAPKPSEAESDQSETATEAYRSEALQTLFSHTFNTDLQSTKVLADWIESLGQVDVINSVEDEALEAVLSKVESKI